MAHGIVVAIYAAVERLVAWTIVALGALGIQQANLKWDSNYPNLSYFLFRFAMPFPSVSAAAAAAKSLQSCPTLCNPIDSSPPGSAIAGILQARTLEWVAISFSNAWKWKVKVNSLSWVWLFATPWTAAHQAPPSMGFSRQEYCSGFPLPSPQSLNCHQIWDQT